MEGTLTPPERSGEDRRQRSSRLRRGAGLALAMMAATPNAGHAEPPAREVDGLVRRALRRAGLDRAEAAEARARRASLWPGLRLGAALRRTVATGRTDWQVSALLTWPLGRRVLLDGGLSSLLASRRAALADRVALLWRERVAAGGSDDRARLDADELDAELEALTGPPDEAPEDER